MANPTPISTFSNLSTSIALARALVGQKINTHNSDKSSHPDLIARINKLEQDVDNILSGSGTSTKIINATPTQAGYLTYDEDSQTPSWAGYDSAKLSISGTTSGTNAGTYSATFTPINGYTWRDGGTGTKTAKWKILKAEGSIVLNPSSKKIEAGKTSTFTVDRLGDGKVSAASCDESIAKVKSVSGNIVTVEGIKAGTATITVSVAAGTNYKKADPVGFTATIKEVQTNITIPTVTNKNFTYDGTEHSPTITNAPDKDIAYRSGIISATNANETGYSFTYSLRNKEKNQWSDETVSNKTFTWFIKKAAGTLSLDSNFGSVKVENSIDLKVSRAGNGTISFSPKNSTIFDIKKYADDDTKFKITGKEAGTAAITVKVAESSNYTAPASQTYNLTVSNKADCNLTLSKTSVTLTKTNRKETITVTREGTGKITVKNNYTDIIKVTGTNTIEISSVGVGTAKITVSVKEDDTHMAATKTITIKSETGKALTDCEPDDIQKIIRNGHAKDTWSVGDYFPVKLKGTMCGIDITGDYVFFILGFDHNKKNETLSRDSVHFSVGQIYNGELRPVAFVNTDYNTPSAFTPHIQGTFCMADKSKSSTLFRKSWINSYVYKYLNDSADSFRKCVPSEWMNIISNTWKYDDNDFDDATVAASPSKSDLKTQQTFFFIPSYIEIYGKDNKNFNPYLADSTYLPAQKNYQEQYDFFKSGNTKKRYAQQNYNKDMEVEYFTRTSVVQEDKSNGTTNYLYTFYFSDGAGKIKMSNVSLGISPCFTVY